MRILNKVIIALIFILAGVLFFHNFTSVNADIGRHIKLGEIIWQTGTVPKINLLSFTAPEYPFINHHWLSEVVFYKIYSLSSNWIAGLKTIMFFKIAVLMGTYLTLFFIVKKNNIFSIVFAFIASIFVFSARTEARPEIFSYLFFSVFLYVIFKARNYDKTYSGLWFLPIVQLFWVNMHIYFAIGPVVYFLFLVEMSVLKKVNRRDLLIGLLIILANLANPNFVAGALYPLKVLGSYGYSVAENSSLFFLAKYFGSWTPQDKLFLISFFILTGSFVVNLWQTKKLLYWLKTRTFDLLLIAMMTVLSFKMQRNIPLFALSLWPVLSRNLSEIFNKFSSINFQKLLSFFVIVFLAISIFMVISGRFYGWLNLAKAFGWNIPSAAQNGTDFIKTNNIRGPVFNNFDIGSYLVWQIQGVRYPDEKVPDPFRVFVDGRPEAYPVSFFEDIYKPMQRDQRIWREMSEKYGINYIFFAHTDMTEWGEEFLTRISKDKEWPMVFLNDSIVVFLKNNDANRPAIDKYKITEDNITEKIPQILVKLDKNDDNSFVNLGNALYRFRWLTGSANVFEALVKNQPDNPYGYQGAGYAYALMNDPATQQKAADNLKKAIDLGFKTFNNYFTLGIVNANLGNFFTAKENLSNALKINPNNTNAKQALEALEKKIYLQ